MRIRDTLASPAVFKPIIFGLCVWLAAKELAWKNGWKAASREYEQQLQTITENTISVAGVSDQEVHLMNAAFAQLRETKHGANR